VRGQAVVIPPVLPMSQKFIEYKKLLLPEKNVNNDRVIAYLTGRSIHREIIDYCIQTNRLVYDEPPKHGKDYNDYLKIQQRNILER